MTSNHLLSIRDNHRHGKVFDFLHDALQDGSFLSIVSAYFTIDGYASLAEKLETLGSLRFLFGDPQFLRSIDPDKTDKKTFALHAGDLLLTNPLSLAHLARRCSAWLQKKEIEIRSLLRSNLLHAKLYHIQNPLRTHALLGSSNFTKRGLGLSNLPNIELNLVVDQPQTQAELKAWFDSLWNDPSLVADVKSNVLDYLNELYADHPPEFIYYKTLFHLFEHSLQQQDDDLRLLEQTHLADTVIWNKLFDFQKDGVKGALHKIKAYGGCILADSVGLGKTFSALAIIKYFELRNQRVLVLCPKKLRENWTLYLAQNNTEQNLLLKDRFAYTVLSHTDLSRESGKTGDIDLASFNWGNFDLVVIDESHNFRNDTKAKASAGGISRPSRYQRLMQSILKDGVSTQVLLLSATPVNNDLKDLKNQIALITSGHDRAFAQNLGIHSVKDTLAFAQKAFLRWADPTTRPSKDALPDLRLLLDTLPSGFFSLLDALTLARSRKQILRYYSSSLQAIGPFPTRKKPLSLSPSLDLQNAFPSYDQLHQKISEYRLSLFNPSRYLKDVPPRNVSSSAPIAQSLREMHLIGMMRVNFLKRLESSVFSFGVTMQRTVAKIDALRSKIDAFLSSQAQSQADLSLDVADDEGEDDDLAHATVGEKLKIHLSSLDLPRWAADLEADKTNLHALALAAKAVLPANDGKLAKLRSLLQDKIDHPTKNSLGKDNRKALVFCAFADTASYLYESLLPWARENAVHIALVAGDPKFHRTTFGRADFHHILTNFSPLSKTRASLPSMPKNAEIDLLLATDCISEGQNLQDCDLLINYDIHWNPVRIIQRFGRIDRIGSKNNEIQLVNFWPTDDLNKYIQLKSRVEARMALVDLAATAEDNLLQNDDDLRSLIEDDLRYRDKQLLRFKDEILDLEELQTSISLGDFSLDDFRLELSSYLQSQRKKLQQAPFGLYAVVESPLGASLARPGVIFCLRQRPSPKESPESTNPSPTPDVSKGEIAVNPLAPYVLLYLHDDGTIRYHFTQPKQILDLFRSLCQGQVTADDLLCKLFNAKTHDGAQMDTYTTLIQKAVAGILALTEKRNLAQFFSGRSGKLLDASKKAKSLDDFELVTWLVLLSPENQ